MLFLFKLLIHVKFLCNFSVHLNFNISVNQYPRNNPYIKVTGCLCIYLQLMILLTARQIWFPFKKSISLVQGRRITVLCEVFTKLLREIAPKNKIPLHSLQKNNLKILKMDFVVYFEQLYRHQNLFSRVDSKRSYLFAFFFF